MPRFRLGPDRTRWCAGHRTRTSVRIVLATLAMMAPAAAPLALHRQAVEQIAARYANKVVVLKGDLRISSGGEGMQAPMLDTKGWHFMSGPSVLRSGSQAEITAVFNYGVRGFFLEIAGAADASEPLLDRPRVRVRVMTDVPSADPSGQAAQAATLIDRILTLTQP
jgi:hypothetical protein